MDHSHGYESAAAIFLSGRGRSGTIGAAVVAAWASELVRHQPQAAVLDIGCGSGIPVTKTLIEHGCLVSAVDASATMIEAFRTNFPQSPAECAAAEHSTFFFRKFDGIVAWGLIFLLPASTQHALLAKISHALNPNGRLLFTAPRQACSWHDAITGRPSLSLGAEVYTKVLRENGLELIRNDCDEGENFYYAAVKA